MRIDLVLLTYICVVLCRSFGVAGKYIQLDLNVALKDVSSKSLSESSQQALFESFNEITNVPIEDMELANVRVKAENKKNHLWDLDVDIRFTITENTFPQYKENSDRENRIRKDIDNAFRQSLLPAPSGKPEDIQLNQVLHKNSIIFARHLIFVQVKSLKIRNSMRLKTLDLASQLFQKKSSVPLNIPPPPENPSSQPSSQPSTQPTGAPTQEFQTRKPTISSFTGTPTESPSESPTESPTENPFGSPTESPTETPTDSPTEVPSFAPTFSFPFNPTETPSESPTESPTDERDQPSSQPSSQPTSAPTLSIALGTYKFSVFLQIDNVTSTSINSADEAVLLQAISDATDVPVKQLEFQTVVDSAQRRRLSVSTSHSLVIEVKFYIYTQDYPELNGDTNKIFLYLSNLLNLSVNEGSLTILLRKESLKFFNQKLLWSRIIKVAYTTFNVPTTPTIMPSPAPTSVPTILPSGSPTTTSSPSISSAPTTTTSPTTTSSPSSSSAPTATTSPTTSMSPTITLSPTIHTPAPSNGGGGGSTLSPTRIPTVFPTRSPSSIGGGGASGVPTISPTSSPTQQVKAIIQYKTWIYLDGCSNSTLRNDSLLAIETALAHVYNISLTHIAYSRSTSGKSINNGYEIAVAYKLTFNLIDYPAYTNATLFYWAQKTILLESWRNGLLKTEILLHSPTTDAYNQLNPTNITNIEFTELSVKDPSNIQSITPNSDDYPTTIKVAILIGIIAGSILGFGLLLLCCYVGYSQYMKAEKAKENSLRIPIQRMPSHDIPLDDIYNWDSHEKSDAIMIDVMDEFDYQISPRNSIMRNHVIDDYDDQMSPRNSMMRGQVLELSFMSHTAESRM